MLVGTRELGAPEKGNVGADSYLTTTYSTCSLWPRDDQPTGERIFHNT